MIIAEIPETTSYFWKQSRSATYNSWPFNDSDKCNAECMAAAGFYVVEGNGSKLVECFMCGKQFGGWKSGDDPWSRHVKCQSICPFVKLNRRDENKWTMKELCYLCGEYEIKVDTDELKKDLAKVKDDMERSARKQSLDKLLNMDKKNRKRKSLSYYQRLSVDIMNSNIY